MGRCLWPRRRPLRFSLGQPTSGRVAPSRCRRSPATVAAAALDVRLVGLDEPLGATKVTTAAKRIHQMWQATRDRRFNDPSGNLHPRPGGLQLVFAELGTPGGKRWGRFRRSAR